jgi:transcriptional regulator with XRE-family HTH domain
MPFGQRLRQARQAAGFDLATVADRLGATVQAVSNYERGVRAPGELDVWRLEVLYGMRPGELAVVLDPRVTGPPESSIEQAIMADRRLSESAKVALLGVLMELLPGTES